MTAKRLALVILILSGGISIAWGLLLGQNSNGWVDFRAVYCGTSCLLQRHNPYNQDELLREYRAEGGDLPAETAQHRQAVTLYVNTPTTFLFVAPFAMLPWGPAHWLWLTLTAGLFLLAGYLMWSAGASYAPKASLFLICVLIANCESLFTTGNAAGIVVPLCVIAVWSFVEERHVLAGVLCLAVSLAVKPHDAGLVWLYFLLSGSIYKKRALQSLFITAVLGVSALVWLSLVAPHWMQDWQSNLSVISAHGGINDPGPTSVSNSSAAMVIDLQAALSILRDEPRFYNPVSYLICGVFLLIWAIRTVRLRISRTNVWFALATIVPFTMLVTYHKPWDAKLLLLAIPASSMLWSRGGWLGRIALIVTAAGVTLTADIPLALLSMIAKCLHAGTSGIFERLLMLVLMRPASMILLTMGIFYLWVYMKSTAERGAKEESVTKSMLPQYPRLIK